MGLYENIEKGKVKRYLNARNKIIYPGGIYHVTHRAPGKELIFVERSDYLRMLALLKEVVKKFSWSVFSFVFIPNHFHLLVKITDADLSAGIKKLCERYAKYFNTKYQRKGPVFSRPYRAALCLDDIYLLSISLYIHLNPFKARLCESIQGYRWSSLNLYLKTKKDSFVDPEFILKTLDKDAGRGRKKYGELLLNSAQIKYKNIIEFPSYINYFEEELRKFLKGTDILKNDPEEQIKTIKESIRSRAPQEKLAKKYLIEQLVARGYKIGEIAQKLDISRMTVYNILNFTKPATLV